MTAITAASTSSSTYTLTANTTAIGGWVPCPTHGNSSCYCPNQSIGQLGQVFCVQCNTWYFPSALNGHQCVYPTYQQLTYTCHVCGTVYYGGSHTCTGLNWNYPNTTTISSLYPVYTELKEITTDEKLEYCWAGASFNMKIPSKFSDCFLKVGYKYSPLYPFIFAARKDNEPDLSFYLITDITGKSFEGDLVILESVSTIKIEDNLVLIQLTERIKNYFEKDKNVPSN